MKTRTKILLDEYIVGPFVKAVNLLVIPLGKIMKIDHDLHKSFSTIAICKYKGMGSIIQSTPLIKTLKRNHPHAKIIFVTSIENKQIINLIEDIDEVIYINDNSFSSLTLSIFPFVRNLMKRKIEVFIDLEVYSNFSTLVSLLSMSKNRLGFYINSKHYRMGNYTHMMYYNTRSSISETYLQFAGMLNCRTKTTGLYKFKPFPLPSTLKGTNLNGLIVINPNASDLRIERQWPREKYIQLIRDIYSNYPDKTVALIGSKKEADYVKGIMLELPSCGQIISLAGKTTIAELVAVIQRAQVVVTNDTGPMHIAFATETQTIALFGPCSPTQYGNNKHCMVVYQNLYCSPCVHEFVTPPCNNNNHCMKSIDSANVFNLLQSYLDGTMEQTSITGVRKEILFDYDDFTIGTIGRGNG